MSTSSIKDIFFFYYRNFEWLVNLKISKYDRYLVTCSCVDMLLFDSRSVRSHDFIVVRASLSFLRIVWLDFSDFWHEVRYSKLLLLARNSIK